MSIFKSLAVWVLKQWSRIKVAPGLLYQIVEKYAPSLYTRPLKTKLFNGYEVECDIREIVQQVIYFYGYYEAVETYFAMAFIKKGDTVIDAGANIGYYSLVAANCVGPGGRVHSFEPIPRNFSHLQDHIHSNHLDKIVTVNNYGVWDKEEEIEFTLSKNTESNFGTYSAGEQADVVEKITCRTLRLDNYVKKNNIHKVNFLKIDVEGAEWAALQGAEETIKRDKPVILLEVCKYTCDRFGYDQNVMWEFLKPLGYKMYLIRNSSKKSHIIDSLEGLEQDNVILFTGDLPSRLAQDWSLKTLRENVF